MRDYKKLTAIVLTVFCIGLITTPPVEASSKWSFVSKIAKKDKKQLSRLARDIHFSSLKRVVPDVGVLSKKIHLPAKMLASPAVRKLAIAGEEVMSHGSFATKMLNNSKVPELVIHQYSKYGKKGYLNVVKKIGITMTKSKSTVIAGLSKLKGKYKGMNNIINKLHAGKYDDDILVRTVRRTGKHGMKVLKWVANHPKFAMAGAAGAWYIYDSEGFEDALTKSGKTIGGFVGETMVSASAGIVEGVISGFTQSFSSHSIGSILGGGIAIIMALLLFMSKTFRRFMLFPFTMLGKKANEKMDKMEQRPSHTSNNEASSSQQNNRNSETKKSPRSNL